MKNKSIKILLSTVFCFSLIAGLTSCKKNELDESSKLVFVEKEFIDFSKGAPSEKVISFSDKYSNGGAFGCEWSKDNVNFDDNGMNFILNCSGDGVYKSAEARTITGQGIFKYGYFGTHLKPSNIVGTASTFFLYTGESEKNPHDEIDIEFLGKDTTKVQFNYFTNDVGNNEFMYDLGFDASQEFHQYGFYWDPSQIIWYVDLQPVYRATKNIPTHGMRLFENFWCGNQDKRDIVAWIGKLNSENLPAKCTYKDILYSDLNGNGIVVPDPGSQDDENKIDIKALGFNSNAFYLVSKNGADYDVSFEQEENMYHALSPNGFAKYKFGNPIYANLKLQNLSNTEYTVNLQYDNSDGTHLCSSGSLVSSTNGTSSYTRTGSTCCYFVLGANDTAEFRVDLGQCSGKFATMDIIAAGGTKMSGSFKIISWFIFDEYPQEQGGEEEINKFDLMNYGFQQTQNYSVEKNDRVYNVSFDQNEYHGLQLIDTNQITVAKPDYAVFKVKNNSNSTYQLAVSFIQTGTSKNACSSGSLVKSQNGTSSYVRHGSTVEYYNLGANDTAEFDLTFLSGVSTFEKIELIAAPGAIATGSFTIQDFYIALQ